MRLQENKANTSLLVCTNIGAAQLDRWSIIIVRIFINCSFLSAGFSVRSRCSGAINVSLMLVKGTS